MTEAGAPSESAWDTIEGAHDLHVHVEPDLIRRRTDDVDLAEDFLRRGLAGFVLKSHYQPTAERAAVVRRAVPGIRAYGALVLNHGVGGLNPVAVDVSGRSGARVVWLPTVDSTNEADAVNAEMPRPPLWVEIQREMAARHWLPPPLSVVDDAGRLTTPARDCLAAAAEHDLIVATGHLSPSEIRVVVSDSRELGLARVVVTHPNFPSQGLSAAQAAQLADEGAWIEYTFTTPHTGKVTWESVFRDIRTVGPERCVISTDLGQRKNPPVAEGLALFAQRLLDAGFDAGEVRAMAVHNPARLLDVEVASTAGKER